MGQTPRAEPSPRVQDALAPLLVDPVTTAIVSDFDGTLSAIVDHPDMARPLTGASDVLAELARQFGTVAVVSGRPAAFLVQHLSVPGWTAAEVGTPRFVGLYGLERATTEGQVVVDPLAAPWRPVIEETVARLRAGAPPGGLVEGKGLAVTVHWRTAPELEAWATSAVAAEAERTGLVAHPGRRSLELRPPLTIDKGSVVRGLLDGATAAAYFGDDIGDLPAFAALAKLAHTAELVAVSVAVADDESPTAVLDAADLVLGGPSEALDALAWLARAATDH